MLDGIKSLGCHTATGIAYGMAFGATGVGIATSIVNIVKDAAEQTIFGTFGSITFREDTLPIAYTSPIAFTVTFGLVGGAIGLICGVTKEVFKNCDMK